MEELSKKATMYIRRYVFECFQNDFPNASKRKEALMDQMRVLGNLSNRYAYEFTQEEVNILFQELLNALEDTKAKFI
jgi:uncharacterized protein with HEPN domain